MIFEREKILEVVPIYGDSILDLGCGAGDFTVEIAKKRPNAKIYAVDIQENNIDKLNHECKNCGITNVETNICDVTDYCGTNLQDECIDTVFVSNLLHQIPKEDRGLVFDEINRVTKRGSVIVFIDWKKNNQNVGPKEIHITDCEDIECMLEKRGNFISDRIDLSPYHYCLMFCKE